MDVVKNVLLAILLSIWVINSPATTYESIYKSPLLSSCSDFQQWHRQIDEFLCYGFQNVELRKNLPVFLERIFGKEEGRELADMILKDEAWKETVNEISEKINDSLVSLSERTTQQKLLKAMLIERAFSLAVARLPPADYPVKVQEACEKAKPDSNSCLEAMLKSDTDVMSSTYRALLQKQSSPSSLISDQNSWRQDMERTCEFGNALGYGTKSAELQCLDNWTRLRDYELSEQLKLLT
ncbi:MAG: lysozyme inhibitor LprI family protein [Burkholderiales bacterium]|nr:lysozyme inhibitor LprI family protein [Burkholderiales bacterium]